MSKIKALTQSRLSRLSTLFASTVASVTWRPPVIGETEPKYTGAVLLPTVEKFVRELDTPGLVVRGDGGVGTRPVSFFGVAFYPDLEISYFDSRALAVEVKFLRSSDPSGSISKALGQAAIYEAGGFPHTHVVLIDCRPASRSLETELANLGGGIQVHHVLAGRPVGASPL